MLIGDNAIMEENVLKDLIVILVILMKMQRTG